MVQKENLNNISDYGIILLIGVPINVLNFNYKIYVKKHVPNIVPYNIPYFDDLVIGENVFDKDVLDILCDMLEIKSQIHKENDGVTLRIIM